MASIRKDEETKMITPLISVVMSAYNAEKYLSEAIDSILNQTFTDFEFIIIDDGSTDGTPNILKTYKDKRLRIISQENMGLAKSLNRGLRVSKGRYIARLDADDIALPNRLTTQYSFMESHPECVASGTGAMIIDEKGRDLYSKEMPLAWHDIQAMLPCQSPFFHSAVIFRRDPALACGGYFEKIPHHYNIQQFEDIVLWNKLTKYGELRNLETMLIKYRLGPFAITNNSNRNFMSEIAKKIVSDCDISDEDVELFKRLAKKQGKRSKLSNYHFSIGRIYLLKGNNRMESVKNLSLSVAYFPVNLKAWFFLFLWIVSCCNGKVVIWWKRYRKIKF